MHDPLRRRDFPHGAQQSVGWPAWGIFGSRTAAVILGVTVRCALAITREVKQLGIEVRAGVHTGECETMGDNVGGMAVNIGARIMSNAKPGSVLVSGTVKDLVAESGIEFEDMGAHALKGVPGEWKLFAAQTQGQCGGANGTLVAIRVSFVGAVLATAQLNRGQANGSLQGHVVACGRGRRVGGLNGRICARSECG